MKVSFWGDGRGRVRHGAGIRVCAVPLGVTPMAHGRVNRRQATIPLDSCTYCGLGGNAIGDLSVLTPGLT